MTLAAPASANVFALDGNDPRIEQPRVSAGRMYMPVGHVTTNGPVPITADGARRVRTQGTGFLVSPCYVLTNYHAVFGLAFDGPEPGVDYRITFSVGDAANARQVQGSATYWGAFNSTIDHDWALVRLDECIGAEPQIGWMELRAEAPQVMAGREVALAAYPRDRDRQRLWVQPSCRVQGVGRGRIKVLHDCAVAVGASGGPLIDFSTGAPSVVAVQSGELNATPGVFNAYDAQYANTAVTVAEILDSPGVAEALAADKAAFGNPNQAIWPALDQGF